MKILLLFIKRKELFVIIFSINTIVFCCAQNAELKIDASKVIQKLPTNMYGSCIEDVNHEIYGGLYDQKIFGESFEEPSSKIEFAGFSKYEGKWDTIDGGVSVQSWAGAKLISNTESFSEGSAEVDIKFTGVLGENAGLIFHVSNAGNGADNFNGYEISLLRNGKKLRLSKHRHNYTFLKEVDVTFNPYEWTKLKVEMKGSQILVYINQEATPAINYTDINSPVTYGSFGLRTWNADVSFKNLKAFNASDIITPYFKITTPSFISSQWDMVKKSTDNVVYAVDKENPYNGINSQSIQYIDGTSKAGIANLSLNRWGIAVNKNQVFEGRLYLRSKEFTGPVTVALQNADGTVTYASQTINNIKENWDKYPFTLTTNSSDAKARFVILIDTPGKIWVDQVVLMQTGEKQFMSLPLRADISNAMVNQGLNFLRYGGTMVNAPEYRFKKMIGDPDKRPPYTGHWNRYSTNGFGIEDFLKYCEKADFTAAFAINIEENAQDAADMIEYLNGEKTTKWGAKRAANGHPEPYNVKYIEIGNEEVLFEGDDLNTYMHYIERFNALYDAMHAKDSSIEFICSAWWRAGSPNMPVVFNAINGKASYWDYHPWADDANSGINIDKELTDMQSYFLNWDPNTTLKCAILEENGNLHNMQRALGHATTLNAVRRHADFLLTSCPANALQPYQQNDNGWDQGQIFFTPTQVWNMPPYYAQQMASRNHLPLLVSSGKIAGLDITATRSINGDTLAVHVVNLEGLVKLTHLSINGFNSSNSNITSYTLSGPLAAENTPSFPEKFKTIENNIDLQADSFNYSFPPYSYTILRFVAKQ